MGHSRREKQTTHERIVRVAAKRFRERGLDGIGVADVMKEAGVTAGASTSTSDRAMNWSRRRSRRRSRLLMFGKSIRRTLRDFSSTI
jgi:hypothetical protein